MVSIVGQIKPLHNSNIQRNFNQGKKKNLHIKAVACLPAETFALPCKDME